MKTTHFVIGISIVVLVGAIAYFAFSTKGSENAMGNSVHVEACDADCSAKKAKERSERMDDLFKPAAHQSATAHEK